VYGGRFDAVCRARYEDAPEDTEATIRVPSAAERRDA
jgi:hypothetical protein